jgi:hypothetical protein
MPSLKNLPGIKQLRGVKDKAVIKIVNELEQGLQEKEAIINNLKTVRDNFQGDIDRMTDLIAEMDDTNDFEQMRRQLMVGNQQYTMRMQTIQTAQKQIQEAEKKIARYEKLQQGFLKLASKDAALQAALAQAS